MNNLISPRSKEFERVASDDNKKNTYSPHSHSTPTKRRQKRNKSPNKYLKENLILNSDDIDASIPPSIDNPSVNSSDSVGLVTSDDTKTNNTETHDENIELINQPQQGHNHHDQHPMEIQNGEDREQTRPQRQRSIHGQTRTSHAFWNLCKCYVGAASFALPWAVSKTGVIPAIIGFFLLSTLAYMTFRWMLISSHFAKQNSNPTYPELAEITFSNFFPLFNNVTNKRKDDRYNNRDRDNNENGFVVMEERESMINVNDTDDNKTNSIEKELYDNMNNQYWMKHNYRCGKIGKILVYICMFLGMIGACGSYILFISGVIQGWLSPLIDPSSSLSFYLSIGIVLPFPICLSLLRSYSFLSATAKFGVAGVVLALIVTIYDGILHIFDGTLNQSVIDKNLIYFDLSGFPIFVGNACFLFVIHAMILSQEQSMIDRSRGTVSSQFKKANNLSLSLVTLINMVFAVFAYISFLDQQPFPDNIVDGLDAGIIQQITRACLCIDLLFTYALIMYPFTEALDTELFDITQLNDTSVIFKGNMIRIGIVIITALIAIGIPHFGYLTGLTGGSASIFLGFILPPIFIWRLAPNKIHWIELYILCPLIFLFGCVMFIWSPYLILTQMYS